MKHSDFLHPNKKLPETVNICLKRRMPFHPAKRHLYFLELRLKMRRIYGSSQEDKNVSTPWRLNRLISYIPNEKPFKPVHNCLTRHAFYLNKNAFVVSTPQITKTRFNGSQCRRRKCFSYIVMKSCDFPRPNKKPLEQVDIWFERHISFYTTKKAFLQSRAEIRKRWYE